MSIYQPQRVTFGWTKWLVKRGRGAIGALSRVFTCLSQHSDPFTVFLNIIFIIENSTTIITVIQENICGGENWRCIYSYSIVPCACIKIRCKNTFCTCFYHLSFFRGG